MDLLARVVQYQQVLIDLTPREFALLEMLLRLKGGCCSRELLMQRVWKTNAESTTNVVEVCVTSVRKKLGRAESSHQRGASLIETIRGQGYRLAIDDVVVSLGETRPIQPLLARGA